MKYLIAIFLSRSVRGCFIVAVSLICQMLFGFDIDEETGQLIADKLVLIITTAGEIYGIVRAWYGRVNIKHNLNDD